MTIIKGNLWNELGKADVILITTNSTIKGDGALVMGRGAAKEALERFPDLPYNLGACLTFQERANGRYGILMDKKSRCGVTTIGAFQTKYHWRDESDLELIKFSADFLQSAAEKHPEKRIALNFPGIGLGRLKESDVLPLLKTLPDNVFIYQL